MWKNSKQIFKERRRRRKRKMAMKKMRTRTLYKVFREEEQDEALLLDRKEEEEEEALASNNFPKIRRRQRRRLLIPPALLFRPTSPPSPDLRKSFPSMMSTTGLSTMLPPTVPWTLSRRSLIRRFADAVADLARTVTTAFSRSPDNIPANNVDCTNSVSNHVTKDEDEYDAAKCVVGSDRTYCRNCRRYHHALVPNV